MKKVFGNTCLPIAAIIFFIAAGSFAFGEEASRYCLKNGAVVLIKESRSSPLAAIEAQIKTGSATEGRYAGSGISHVVEHMLFKGTKGRPSPGQIEREIKAMGGYINAFTSHDSTGVKIILPSNFIDQGLDILKDIITEPLFDPQELEREREVILKEVRLNQDDPDRYLSLLLWANMFKDHHYRFPVIGYEPLLKKITRDNLLDYHAARYIPDNLILGIVGDISKEDVLKKADELFGSIARASPNGAYSPQEPQQTAPIEVTTEKDLSLAYIAMGFRGIAIGDKNLFCLDVLSIILGDGEDSRLYRALYKEKQLVYSIGSFNYTPKAPGIFAVSAACKKENVELVIDEVLRQIERLKTKPVSGRELTKAKNLVLSGYVFSRQTVQGEAGDLAGGELLTGDYAFSKKYIEAINKVTKEEVIAAARRYLAKENLTLLKLLPKTAVEKNDAPAKRKAALLPRAIERIEFENGLRLLICQERSHPIIGLTALGFGGLRIEDFKNNGLSNLAAQTLLCGTKTRGEEAIFSEIEGRGAAINSFSASNTFGVSVNGLSRDFDALAEVFSDVIQRPIFSDEKIAREKAAIQSGIKTIDEDIYQTGMRTLRYILFKRHPYRFQAMGRPSTITRLTKGEVLGLHKKFYTPNNMVIVISGDINKSQAMKKISSLFRKFAKGAPLQIKPPIERRRAKPRIVKRAAQKEQSLVLLGFKGATIYGHDKYILDALMSVLSGVNGRLSQSIREKQGLAYTLDAKSLPGLEPGLIIFYIGTTKENLETAKIELFKEIRALLRDGIDKAELEAAKKELIGHQRMGLQRIQDVGTQAALGELCGLGFDDFLNYEGRINRVTKESVLRAARKYLNMNSYALVLLEGAGKGA